MSLINDALKRASQSQKKQPPAPASGGAPMQPVETPQERSFPLFLLILLVVVFLGAGFLLWRLSGRREAAVPDLAARTSPPAASAPTPTMTVAETPKPKLVISTNVVTRPIPVVQAPAPAPLVTPAPVAVSPAPQAAPPAVTPAVPGVFPELKLQGIFYRLRNPTVLINGKTLGKGEEVEGARVSDIERLSVVVEWNGEKKTLKLDSP